MVGCSFTSKLKFDVIVYSIEKEEFQFDKLDNLPSTETESATGRVAAAVQEKAVKLLQRRR